MLLTVVVIVVRSQPRRGPHRGSSRCGWERMFPQRRQILPNSLGPGARAALRCDKTKTKQNRTKQYRPFLLTCPLPFVPSLSWQMTVEFPTVAYYCTKTRKRRLACVFLCPPPSLLTRKSVDGSDSVGRLINHVVDCRGELTRVRVAKTLKAGPKDTQHTHTHNL